MDRVLPRAFRCLSVVLLLGACKVYDPLYCDESRPCKDAARPFCDIAGAFPASDGIGNTCIADPGLPTPDGGAAVQLDGGSDALCEAGQFIQCRESNAEYCNEQGTGSVVVECPAGCSDQMGCSCTPGASVCRDEQTIVCNEDGEVEQVDLCPMGCDAAGARCNDLDPSNALASYLDMSGGTNDVILQDGARIDTDTGEIFDGDGTPIAIVSDLVPAPAGGVPVRVLMVNAIDFGSVVVEGDAAMAVVSNGDIVVRGLLQVVGGSLPAEIDPTCHGLGGGACFGGGGGGGVGGRGGSGGSGRTKEGDSMAGGRSGGTSGTIDLSRSGEIVPGVQLLPTFTEEHRVVLDAAEERYNW